MSKFFIHRPIFAIVVALMLVVLGIISAYSLPIAQYPQISPPTISVSTSYLGANASVVNQTVAQVIEDQVNGTQGMDYMSSSSDDSGSYSLSVRFNLDSDADMDAVKVQNNVAIANASLPSDVQSVGVTTRKSSNDMALMISLYSPEGSYDSVFLKNYADIYLLDKIKRINGVGDVSIFGSDYSMRVWIDPDKLSSLGLTAADVESAIKKQNVQAAAGTVGQLPAPQGQEKQMTGELNGRLSTVQEFENIVLKVNDDGDFVRLKDVARVETGAKSNTTYSDANGHAGVGFGVQLTSDANALETIQKVKQVLSEAKVDFPSDMDYKTIVDNTLYIQESIQEVIKTFVEALLLVVIIVFLFLQSWRATLIPLLAVPVSLIGTFITFTYLGFTINTLTLFAMVLAIGLVVDDAIVVIENVEHHMTVNGLNPVDATERAMEEVQGPVVAIAFVLAAVFVPVAFMEGTTGVLYKQFALTIAISVGLSAFVALSLTPALCALLLRPHTGMGRETWLGRFFDGFNHGFERWKRRYAGAAAWWIRHAKAAVACLLVICGLALLCYQQLPSSFVPDEDQGYFLVTMSLPEGTSLNRTMEVAENVGEDLKGISGIQNVMKVCGYDMLSGGAKSSAATFFVGLDSWAERNTADKKIGAIIASANALGKKYPEAVISGFTTPSLPGLGMVGGWTMELEDMSGHTERELADVADKIVAAANQRPELSGVRTTYTIRSPKYAFDVDRDQVNKYGVDISDVFTALQINYGGAQVNDFTKFARNYKVMLQADTDYRSDAEALQYMYVKNQQGDMVPLSELLKPRLKTAASIISRFNGAQSVEISGNAADGYSSGQAMAAMEEIVHETAPSGFEVDWSGQSREEKEASGSTAKTFGLSLLFVFLCLAALYESWSVPYAVLLTVPTGIFGAFVTVWGLRMLESFGGLSVAGLENSVYMQIGVIMIMGLAAKNAILIVEFAKVRTDRGMDPVRAAIEAAKLRLRPILMTSLAFIIGCLPLAVATGAGAAARNNMGTAVVGGMLFATSLGIFLIPVFFVVIETLAAKMGFLKKAAKRSSEEYM